MNMDITRTSSIQQNQPTEVGKQAEVTHQLPGKIGQSGAKSNLLIDKKLLESNTLLNSIKLFINLMKGNNIAVNAFIINKYKNLSPEVLSKASEGIGVKAQGHLHNIPTKLAIKSAGDSKFDELDAIINDTPLTPKKSNNTPKTFDTLPFEKAKMNRPLPEFVLEESTDPINDRIEFIKHEGTSNVQLRKKAAPPPPASEQQLMDSMIKDAIRNPKSLNSTDPTSKKSTKEAQNDLMSFIDEKPKKAPSNEDIIKNNQIDAMLKNYGRL